MRTRGNEGARHDGFRGDDRGGVAIIFALLCSALFGAIALTIDMARAQNTSAKLMAALDAAALAGAKALDRGATDSAVRIEAESYFRNHLASLRVTDVTWSGFQTLVNRQATTVETRVSAQMATAFGGIIGTHTVDLNRATTVSYKARDVELALALDITGSMADAGKLTDLKVAAKEVVDALLEDAPSETSARIALMPWSAAVNAGSVAALVSAGASTDGCVLERRGADAATDAYPSGSALLPAAPSVPYGYYSCPPNPVTPLMGRSRQSDLKADIDSYIPFGGTAGHIGAAWGWYALSPEWSSIWPFGSRPAPYNPADTIKSVLLMTDGRFNLSYLSGSGSDITTMTEESYAQFQALCTAMKVKRIVVYTVGFGLSDTRAIDELRACASSDSHFFAALTGNELRVAFKQITTQLKGMRLTR
jgi:Flp pilus assembly protein TadG